MKAEQSEGGQLDEEVRQSNEATEQTIRKATWLSERAGQWNKKAGQSNEKAKQSNEKAKMPDEKAKSESSLETKYSIPIKSYNKKKKPTFAVGNFVTFG